MGHIFPFFVVFGFLLLRHFDASKEEGRSYSHRVALEPRPFDPMPGSLTEGGRSLNPRSAPFYLSLSYFNYTII